MNLSSEPSGFERGRGDGRLFDLVVRTTEQARCRLDIETVGIVEQRVIMTRVIIAIFPF